MKKIFIFLVVVVFMLIIYVWQRSYTFRLMNQIRKLEKEHEAWERKTIKMKIEYERIFSPVNILNMEKGYE